MSKRLLSIAIALVLVAVFYTGALAIQSFYKQVSGIGNVEYNGEVTVANVLVAGPTRVNVILESTATTEADYSYTVTLYLDGVSGGSQSASWTAPQIPSVRQTVAFTGLALGSVGAVGVEVIR